MPTPLTPRLELKHALKTYTHAQDKTVDPKTTIAQTLIKLAQMPGTEVVELVERDCTVGGTFAFSSLSPFYSASGKGLTAEQAQASAVMELAERYAWLTYAYDQHPDYVCANYRDLVQRGVPAVEPSYFLSNFGSVTERSSLTEMILDIPLKWVTGTDLAQQTPFYYPINWHNLVFSSNGLAAGNCLEEAIVQGLCEVIERENVFRFFVDRSPGLTVDLEAITHPLIRSVVANARTAQIDLHAVDISGELGIPTFVVRGTRFADFGQLTFEGVGQGSHPDPEKALIRALSEYFEGYTSTRNLQDKAAIKWSALPKGVFGFHAQQNPEMFARSSSVTRLSEIESFARPDIRDEIDLLVEHLARRSYRVVVVDKTHPRLAVPTVRVLVPGMRCSIGGNCIDPAGVLAAVSHESRDATAISRFGSAQPAAEAFAQVLARDPALAEAMPTLSTVMTTRGEIFSDYRKYVAFWISFRKAVIKDFATFARTPLMAGTVDPSPKSLHQRILGTLPNKRG